VVGVEESSFGEYGVGVMGDVEEFVEAERVRRRCARWGSERRYIVMDVVAVMRFGEVKSRILG